MRILLIVTLLSMSHFRHSPMLEDAGTGWLICQEGKCNIHYQPDDLPHLPSYRKLIRQGIREVESFWGEAFAKEFELFIHPDRSSLDQAWRSNWELPDFSSECWMVASGVADRMDLLSPAVWSREACEHRFEELEETQKLISHELFHVFHGQNNASPDFSHTDGIDWFVEGLATFASGQYDEERKSQVLEATGAGQIPLLLKDFWKGDLRYGFSASLVQFIDETCGRSSLRKLLGPSTLSDLLQYIQSTEFGLISDWYSSLQPTEL